MLRHTSKKASEQKEELPPSLEQIATLHGLLNEIKELAPEVNTLVNSILFATLSRGAAIFLQWPIVYGATGLAYLINIFWPSSIKRNKDEIHFVPVMLAGVILAIGCFLTWHKMWELSRTLPLKKFPHGIGLGNEDLTLRTLQKNILRKMK